MEIYGYKRLISFKIEKLLEVVYLKIRIDNFYVMNGKVFFNWIYFFVVFKEDWKLVMYYVYIE